MNLLLQVPAASCKAQRTVIYTNGVRRSPASRTCHRERAAGLLASLKDDQGSGPSFQYKGPEGIEKKATIEQIYTPDYSNDDTPSVGKAPWNVGWQMNERNLVWSSDLKLRLIKVTAAEQLGVTEGELELRLEELANLLPDFADRLSSAPAKLVARLLASLNEVASRILRFRTLFPEANVSRMMNIRLSLILDDDMDDIVNAAARLHELLPELNIDRLVETYPQILDIETFEVGLEDAKRLLPGKDIQQLMKTDPQLIISCMKGKYMIPYDQYAI